MTQITPTFKKVNPPSLPEVLDSHKRDIQKSINCVRIGVIVSFNAGGSNQAPTASVKIAQQQVTSISPTGIKTFALYPTLLDVPVVFPHGGGFSMTFPVAVGDECLLFFNDRELDNWLSQGAGQAPTTGRLHDLSDAFAFVGIRSNPKAISGISTTAASLRTDDNSSFVEIDQSGNVKVHAKTSYEWDVNGYGQKITWTGGTNWTIDNYTTGATVTTNNHNINPPGPP